MYKEQLRRFSVLVGVNGRNMSDCIFLLCYFVNLFLLGHFFFFNTSLGRLVDFVLPNLSRSSFLEFTQYFYYFVEIGDVNLGGKGAKLIDMIGNHNFLEGTYKA